MAQYLRLTCSGRSQGYTRAQVRQDVLYSYCRFRELSISVSKKERIAARIADGMADQMLAWALITPQQKSRYEQIALERLFHIDQFDQLSAEALYRYVHGIRKEVLGRDALEAYQTRQALSDTAFRPDGIDQQAKKGSLLARCDGVLLALTQAELFGLMNEDLHKLRGKQLWVLCGSAGDQPPSKDLMSQWLGDCSGIRFLELTEQGISYDGALQTLIDEGRACLLVYGEEGLCACRGLSVDAVVHAVPAGYHAQALTGLWSGEGSVVYIPPKTDMTALVPLTQKTRLNYCVLSRLWQDHGDSVYGLTVEELYCRYPRYFMNIYSGIPSDLPISIAPGNLPQFDRQLDEGLIKYLGSFKNAEYMSAYFDEALTRQPVCYDGQKQPGILVQAVKIRQAAGARILSCEKGVTPRQLFREKGLPGVGLVSNFLFFMTPKLGILYNDLRADRPMEQADAASGHLDYMLTNQDGKRTETFPLFGKSCIAMKQDGKFLFFNYRLGGGSVTISGIKYRWNAAAVDSDTSALRVYTPFYSAADKDAERDTYRKAVGAGRVNVILLRDKVTCIRKGDVLLPSVGVVLSMTEAVAAPLLETLTPLEDGYYDVSGLELTVLLDGPTDVSPEDWAQVRWAYGGGLTLIRDGVGLCDGDRMEKWFDAEGWTSPLSRQTQESTLHTLVKHPRTAIGCTKDGALAVLVYSGRTWRSTGADYREMIAIARQLFPDIRFLMNCDGGGSAMLGMVRQGDFMELSYPSTSSGSCAGQVRPVNTVFYMPIE